MVLEATEGDDSDYINASYVDVSISANTICNTNANPNQITQLSREHFEWRQPVFELTPWLPKHYQVIEPDFLTPRQDCQMRILLTPATKHEIKIIEPVYFI